MNARESKTALDKIREAFEGRYSKHAKKEKMVVGAVLASLVISTHTDWALLCYGVDWHRIYYLMRI